MACGAGTQKAVSTDGRVHGGNDSNIGLIFAPNVSEFDFAKCQQVFIADNVNGNFVPVPMAQLTGKLGCVINFDVNDNVVGTPQTTGSAKLIQGLKPPVSGHRKSPGSTPTTIESFTSADGVQCISGTFLPFASDTSVAAAKLNEHAAAIKRLILKEAAARSRN